MAQTGPFETAEEFAAAVDKVQMKTQDEDHDIQAWLRLAKPEELRVVRTLLRRAAGDLESYAFIDGQIVAVMRHVHGVDPDTAKPFGAELAD